MFTIRPAQMAALSEEATRSFEDWVLAHLRRCFPEQCTTAGETELCDTIQYGIARAGHYGITAASDVCKYIDVMVLFGRDFDTRCSWANQILTLKGDPRRKLAGLLEMSKQNLGRRR